VAAVVAAVLVDQVRRVVLLGVLCSAYVVVVALLRQSEAASLGWVYRPLQPFLIAFAVGVLFRGRRDRGVVGALAWGSTIGCSLAVLATLIPGFDPFELSRPHDIPFVSQIGSFARATGGFVYPNNLGTFAAYSALLGLAALLVGRPALSRRLAAALAVSSLAALLLSGARAAMLGLMGGAMVLALKANVSRRLVLVGGGLVVVLILLLTTGASRSADVVLQERLSTATGSSLSIRTKSWNAAIDDIVASPVFGVGALESRLDSMWLLAMQTGGIVGVAILVLLAKLTWGGDRKLGVRYPEVRFALVIAFCISGVFQDSLGQTLASWALGAMLGVASLPPTEVEEDAPAEDRPAVASGAAPR
jgi:hypothetical protein